MAALAHSRYGFNAVFKRKNGIDAETVHADKRTIADQFFQVSQVGGVAGVSDHHAREINTLFAEDPLLVKAHTPPGVGMRGNGHSGLPMRLCRTAQNSFTVLATPRLVAPALH